MMKKMWKMRKDKSAVSPVIATILMVAITVVLAAVLYVMVMGFGGQQSSTPTGTFSIAAGTNGYSNISFGQINPDTKYSDCKLTVQDQVASGTLLVSNVMTAAGTATSATGMAGVTATGTNAASNGKISVGDGMTLSGTAFAAGHTYKVQLLHVATGGVIASQTFIAA